MRLLFASLLLLGSVLNSAPALANGCLLLSYEDARREAQAVLLARITRAERVDNHTFDVEFEQLARWKGRRSDRNLRITVRLGRASPTTVVDSPVAVGDLAVFYARRSDGRLQSSWGPCHRSARATMTSVGALGAPRWRRVSARRVRTAALRAAEPCTRRFLTHFAEGVSVSSSCPSLREGWLPEGAYFFGWVGRDAQGAPLYATSYQERPD